MMKGFKRLIVIFRVPDFEFQLTIINLRDIIYKEILILIIIINY